ncbi:protein of unknown function [Listeria monocytogenes R479a]|nr:protein of unknown function [Listeria monocytogenes R479a]
MPFYWKMDTPKVIITMIGSYPHENHISKNETFIEVKLYPITYFTIVLEKSK